jgi:hypothetical protein
MDVVVVKRKRECYELTLPKKSPCSVLTSSFPILPFFFLSPFPNHRYVSMLRRSSQMIVAEFDQYDFLTTKRRCFVLLNPRRTSSRCESLASSPYPSVSLSSSWFFPFFPTSRSSKRRSVYFVECTPCGPMAKRAGSMVSSVMPLAFLSASSASRFAQGSDSYGEPSVSWREARPRWG